MKVNCTSIDLRGMKKFFHSLFYFKKQKRKMKMRLELRVDKRTVIPQLPYHLLLEEISRIRSLVCEESSFCYQRPKKPGAINTLGNPNMMSKELS